jgi:hypothetical protein
VQQGPRFRALSLGLCCLAPPAFSSLAALDQKMAKLWGGRFLLPRKNLGDSKIKLLPLDSILLEKLTGTNLRQTRTAAGG